MKIEHHVKYKEIHGIDETVFMTISEHKKLHIRLRKEGKCNILPDELQKISRKAYHRTDKFKNTKTYLKNKVDRLEWLRTQNRIVFSTTETLAENICFKEFLRYNSNTGNFSYVAFFVGNHNNKLIEVNI